MGIQSLKGKSILVVGLGKTGWSVCRYLAGAGLAFDVVDDRAEPPNRQALEALGTSAQLFNDFSAQVFCRYEYLIVSPGLALSTPAVQAAILQGSQAIGDVELFARVVDKPVIAVTGSNGKSTVVAWLHAVACHAGLQSVLCGNIGEPVLDAIDATAQLYILELSSFQLETTRSLIPLSATVLNLSEDHMDRYESLEHYAQVKRTVYNRARLCVVNADDSRTEPDDKVAPDCILHFGDIAPSAGSVGITNVAARQWLADAGGNIIETAELPLPGQHNRNNALAVIALLSPLKLDRAVLREGLKLFQGLAHRTQLVHETSGVRWFNDSKGTNVDACCNAIVAMAAPVILIAGGQGKDADFNALRPQVEAHVKLIVLLGQDAHKLQHALQDLAECRHAKDMHEAVAIAGSYAVAGDCVLLSPACASFDMFRNFEHRGEVFTEAARELAA